MSFKDRSSFLVQLLSWGSVFFPECADSIKDGKSLEKGIRSLDKNLPFLPCASQLMAQWL